MPASLQDSPDAAHAQAGNAEQGFARGGVHIDGEETPVPQGPGQLGVRLEVQVGLLRADQFAGGEAVEAHEPVGLVEAVLADQGWRCLGQQRVGLGHRAECRVVHAFEPVSAVQAAGGFEDVEVGGWAGADDHLGGLAGGRERRGP